MARRPPRRVPEVAFTPEQQEQLRARQPHNVYKVRLFTTSANPRSYGRTVVCPPTQPLREFLASAGIPVQDTWVAVSQLGALTPQQPVDGTTAWYPWDGVTPGEGCILLPVSPEDGLVCEVVQSYNLLPQSPHPSLLAAEYDQHVAGDADYAAQNPGSGEEACVLPPYTPQNPGEYTRWNARVAASIIALRCCCDNSSAVISQIAEICAINAIPLAAFLPSPLKAPECGVDYTHFLKPSGHAHLCGHGPVFVGYNNERGLPAGAPVTIAVELNGRNSSQSCNIQATMSTSLCLFLRLMKREGIFPESAESDAYDDNGIRWLVDIEWNGEAQQKSGEWDPETGQMKQPGHWIQYIHYASKWDEGDGGPTLAEMGATNGSVLVYNEQVELRPRPRRVMGRPFTSAGLVASGELKMQEGLDDSWAALSVTQVLNDLYTN